MSASAGEFLEAPVVGRQKHDEAMAFRLTLTCSSKCEERSKRPERVKRRESRLGSLEVDYWREAGNNERNSGTKDEGDAGEDEE